MIKEFCLECLAQMGAEASPATILVAYGPMGVMLGWFMLRYEKVIGELRRLSHRIEGLSKAMLVDVLSRETAGSTARTKAIEILNKMDDGK